MNKQLSLSLSLSQQFRYCVRLFQQDQQIHIQELALSLITKLHCPLKGKGSLQQADRHNQKDQRLHRSYLWQHRKEERAAGCIQRHQGELECFGTCAGLVGASKRREHDRAGLEGHAEDEPGCMPAGRDLLEPSEGLAEGREQALKPELTAEL